MKKRNTFVVVDEDFETLCINAIRYCMGRQTYMPSLTIGIVKPYLKDFSDKSLKIMISDCKYQWEHGLYGNDVIDRPMWVNWCDALSEELERRKIDSVVNALIERSLPKDIDVYDNQSWYKDIKYRIYDCYGIEIYHCEDKNYIEILGMSKQSLQKAVNKFKKIKEEEN